MAPKYTGHHTTKRERDDARSCEGDRHAAQQQIKLLEVKCAALEVKCEELEVSLRAMASGSGARHAKASGQPAYWERKELQQAMEKYNAPTGDGDEVSYRVGGEELTNVGRASLTVEFTSVENMFFFRDKLTPQSGWPHNGLSFRRKDSLDDAAKPSRQFVLRREVDEPLRVKCLTTTET